MVAVLYVTVWHRNSPVKIIRTLSCISWRHHLRNNQKLRLKLCFWHDQISLRMFLASATYWTPRFFKSMGYDFDEMIYNFSFATDCATFMPSLLSLQLWVCCTSGWVMASLCCSPSQHSHEDCHERAQSCWRVRRSRIYTRPCLWILKFFR